MPSLEFPALGDVRADGYVFWTPGSKLSPWVMSLPAECLPCLLSSLKMSSLDGGARLVPGCQRSQARPAVKFSDACHVTWLSVGRRKGERSWSLLLEHISENAGITRYLSSPITPCPPRSWACSLEGYRRLLAHPTSLLHWVPPSGASTCPLPGAKCSLEVESKWWGDHVWFYVARILHERDLNASPCEQKCSSNENGAYSAALNALELKLGSEAPGPHV